MCKHICLFYDRFYTSEAVIKNGRICIVEAISKLPQGDVKKLQGQEAYKIRVGNYRIIFDRNGDVLYIERIYNERR